jgi:hypothetical protein
MIRAAKDLPRRSKPALEGGSVIGFKDGEACPKELALGYDHDVESRRDVIMTEDLSYQSFSAVSLNRTAELLGCCHAQPPNRHLVRSHKQRAKPGMNPRPRFIDRLKLCVTPDPLTRPECQPYSLLTVSRFRPLARRRFSTRRPFLVLMRTRNPCAVFRWRVLG